MRRAGIILMATLMLVLSPAMVRAGAIETADAKSREAAAAESQSNWQGALDLYIEAYQTYPKAEYVFSIANCYVKLGNLPRALDAYLIFNQYEPSKEISAKVEQEVAKLEAMLKKEYGKVFIASSPSNSVVFIGEISKQNQYATPTTRWLKPGKHSIIFNKEGYTPRELQVEVEQGGTISVYAGLRPQ